MAGNSIMTPKAGGLEKSHGTSAVEADICPTRAAGKKTGLQNLDLQQLYFECETIQERLARLAGARIGPISSGSPRVLRNCRKFGPDVSSFPREWQTILGGSEADDRVSRRLMWSDWTSDDLEAALLAQSVCGTEQVQLPEWAVTIGECSAALCRESECHARPSYEETRDPNPCPFDGLLAPVVRFAVEGLRKRQDRNGRDPERRLSRAAVDQLAQWLRFKLASLSEDTLFEAFSATRPLLQNLLLLTGDETETAPTFARYNSFVAHHRRNGFREIFATYPMLARLIGTTLVNWTIACAELIERLEDDWDELAAFAGFPIVGTMVDDIRCGLSDSHHGGRSVFILKFAGGVRVVYKPRELGLERELRVLAESLSRTCSIDIVMPRVLLRPEYGWTEFVADERDGVALSNEVFWKSAGALMGLLHIVGGRDAHAENVVVTKAGPVLIDAEVMFSASHALEAESPVAEVAERIRAMDNLVTATGLLPQWTRLECGPESYADASGLGALFPEGSGQSWCTAGPRTNWLAVNSDQMRPRTAPKTDTAAHEPQSEAANSRAAALPLNLGITDELIAAVLDGFERIYRAAGSEHAEMKRAIGRFADAKWRLIHRPTRVYHLLLREALHPRRLRSGLQFGLHLEKLMATAVAQNDKPHAWPVFVNSIEQMSALDIPYYCSRVAGRQLYGDASAKTPLIATWESGLESTHARLEAFSTDNLRLQREYIRATFEARRASANRRPCTPVSFEWSSDQQLRDADETLLEAAVTIADQIAMRAVKQAGHLTWLAPIAATETGHLTAQPIGCSLYQGASGVALFLAALDRALGQSTYESLWVDAFSRVRNWSGGTTVRLANLGLANGFGSYIYAFAVLRDLADERQRDWIDASARKHIAALSDRLIAADTAHDVLGGAAGAILALVAYYRSSGEQAAVKKALICADHLIASYSGLASHAALDEAHVRCGMSHGAAGVALSLGRLWEVTGDVGLAKGVSRLVAFEDRNYCHDTKNWRHLRQGGHADVRAWCHGAPGIALARGGLVKAGLHKQDKFIFRDWTRAIRGSQADTSPRSDHACCGLVGTMDALLQRGVAMGDQKLISQARGLALQMVRSSATNGTPRLQAWNHAPFFDPSFFRGLSGIGYAYLRAAAPGRLPSILGFETATVDTLVRPAERKAVSVRTPVDRQKEGT